MDGAGRGGAPRDGGSSLRAPPAAGEEPRSNLAALTLTLALTLTTDPEPSANPDAYPDQESNLAEAAEAAAEAELFAEIAGVSVAEAKAAIEAVALGATEEEEVALGAAQEEVALGATEEVARPAHVARWQMGPALRCRPCAPWRPERSAVIRDAWRAGGTPRRHRGNGMHDVRGAGPTTWSPCVAAPRRAAKAPRSPSAVAAAARAARAAAAASAGSPYTAAAAARSPSATASLTHGCSLPLAAAVAASHTPSVCYTPLAAAVAAEAYLLAVAAAVAAAPEASSEHLVVGARKHSWKGARIHHIYTLEGRGHTGRLAGCSPTHALQPYASTLQLCCNYAATMLQPVARGSTVLTMALLTISQAATAVCCACRPRASPPSPPT